MTDLIPDALMREAEHLTGLDDWGPPGFREGLAAYCAAVAGDEDLKEPQRIEARAHILHLLQERLALYRDRGLFPQIAGQTIRRPLFITGLPRSASTLLHGLLAQDPRARSIATWEHEQISPPARAESYLTDPRIARTEARIAAIPREALRVHRVGARLPDECNFVTTLAFQSINLHSRYYWSPYVDWYLRADDTPAFELHRHVLQHMQAFCRRDWWVLKSPPHIFHLPRIFATYPDARVIFLHRDPGVGLASAASLFVQGKRRSYREVDVHRAARETLIWWKTGLDRALAFRSTGSHRDQIFDLHYPSVAREPMSAIAGVYDWLDVELTPAALAAMQAFLAEHPKDKYGAHGYDAADYGIDPGAIRRQYADYIDAYSIPLEQAPLEEADG